MIAPGACRDTVSACVAAGRRNSNAAATCWLHSRYSRIDQCLRGNRTVQFRHNRYSLDASWTVGGIRSESSTSRRPGRRRTLRVTHIAAVKRDTPFPGRCPVKRNWSDSQSFQVSGFRGDSRDEVYDPDHRVHGRGCLHQLSSGWSVWFWWLRSIVLCAGCQMCSGVCTESRIVCGPL